MELIPNNTEIPLINSVNGKKLRISFGELLPKMPSVLYMAGSDILIILKKQLSGRS